MPAASWVGSRKMTRPFAGSGIASTGRRQGRSRSTSGIFPPRYAHAPAAGGLERRRVALQSPHDRNRAGRADLPRPADRRRPVEEAERAARRPVADVAQGDGGLRLAGLHLHARVEVDLVAPGAEARLYRKGVPERVRRGRVAQRGEESLVSDLDGNAAGDGGELPARPRIEMQV